MDNRKFYTCQCGNPSLPGIHWEVESGDEFRCHPEGCDCYDCKFWARQDDILISSLGNIVNGDIDYKALLAEAVEELEDIVSYVPEYLRWKWDYDATIARLKGFLE